MVAERATLILIAVSQRNFHCISSVWQYAPTENQAIVCARDAPTFFTRQQILCDPDGCKCFRKLPMSKEIKDCKNVWLNMIKKYCPEINAGGKIIGHVPDTCAGGHPAPGTCFLPQGSACNSSLGGHCPKNSQPCYNRVVIKVDGKPINDKYNEKKPLDTFWVKKCYEDMQTRKNKVLNGVKNDLNGPIVNLIPLCNLVDEAPLTGVDEWLEIYGGISKPKTVQVKFPQR